MLIRKKNYFFFAVAGIILSACSNGSPLRIPKISTDFLNGDPVIFKSDFFLIGPHIDSVNAEVIADCDCCASELILLNDSSFIYKVLCLSGDSYIKGNYVVFGNLLVLHTDEKVVSTNYEYVVTPNPGDIPIPVTYDITRQERKFHVYKISTLKGKQFITYSSKDYKEYGMPVIGSMNNFLTEFRKEKVLRRFLEEE